MQWYVDADHREHYFTIEEQRPDLHDQLRALALLDIVANNTDRKSGHCLLAGDRVWGIDNGLCFAPDFKLRTVIWEFAGEALTPVQVAAVEALAACVPPEVAELISPIEVEALRGSRDRQGAPRCRGACSRREGHGGLIKPAGRLALVKALKEEIGLPVHFHTHDTSGISARACSPPPSAGVDAVDAAMDAFSGGTSQPCLGSIVEAVRHTERDTGLDIDAIRQISDYWEAVRAQYAAFEAGSGPASEVYLHEMPGGQFTNLKAQARSIGLEERWHEVAQTYAEVNRCSATSSR